MKTSVHVIFKGMVQGVFFRDFTQRKSIENDLFGWVKNMDNGDVEAVFEGDDDKIHIVIEWLKHEHPYARVDKVICSNIVYSGKYKSFDIRY